MQVSVETLSDLERRVTVKVPAEKLAKEIQDRLLSLSRQVRVDGFRPGKAPPKMVKRLYGDRVRYEAVTELVEHTLQEALVQEKLSPVGGPKIEPKNLADDNQDLEYSATFEVMPEFELAGFETIQVERPVAEITEQDVDQMIQTLREQRVTWQTVARPAATGDRLRIDFVGTMDGQDFPGGKGENAGVILGKGTMLADFEAHLSGLSAEEETEFDLVFPEDYHAKDVAGKTAHFKVKVHTVEEAILPEIDDAFAASFDVKEDGVAGLRRSLRENMERELRSNVTTALKNQVMHGLWAANQIPLPKALIHAEIERLAHQLRFPEHPDEQTQQLKFKLFEAEARRRVAFGLLMSRLVAASGIKVDEERVRNYLQTVSSTYQDPAEVLGWYEKTPEALEQVQALVLEDQLVDWLLERAQVTEKVSTFAEVMALSKRTAETPEQAQEMPA